MELEQIVSRCQAGDQQALGQLYTATREQLRQVCLRYVADVDVADDLLHDSYLLIFSKIGELKDVSRAEPWMRSVVRNLSLLYLRRHDAQRTYSLDEVQQAVGVAAPEPMAITYDEILHIVDSLPESYRRVFRLSVLEGLSHKQIAALLNIEPHTSSAQLYRAKLLLRQSLRLLVLGLLAVAVPVGVYRWLHHAEVETPLPAVKDNQVSAQQLHAPPLQGRGAAAPVLAESVARGDVATIRPADTTMTILPADTTMTVQPADTATVEPTPRPDRQTERHYAHRDQPVRPVPVGTKNRWDVQLAYSGMGTAGDFNLPYADADWNDLPMDTVTHHRMPLTVGVQADYRLGRRWSVGTGLQLTWLSSETRIGNTAIWQQERQRLSYLGIPLRVQWRAVGTRQWHVYGTAGLTMDLPLRGTLHRDYFMGGTLGDSERLTLSPSVQWSVGGGLGVEYRLTPRVGLYAEPSLHYYLGTGDGLDTYRTKHPATLSVPLGLRIHF